MGQDWTIVLPRRTLPQPQPHVNQGGDCGACVFSGLTGLAVHEVYERFGRGNRYGEHGTVSSLNEHEMRQALIDARSAGLLADYVIDHPHWQTIDEMAWFGSPATHQCQQWWNYVRLGLRAGFYGVACVDHARQGLRGAGADHWVLVCGEREIHPEETGAIRQEVLVSNSSATAKPEEWVDLHDFLRDWGGFNLFLARPPETPA